MLYLAALKDIPRELFESADIDGATWLQKTIFVIVPLVRHATLIAVAIGVVLSVKVFDLVFLMAGGYYKSEVLSTLIWRLAFTRYRMGDASAVSIMQFFFVVLLLVPHICYDALKSCYFHKNFATESSCCFWSNRRLSILLIKSLLLQQENF